LTSPEFSARERAAVLWAEHVARNTAGSSDDVFAEVAEQFGPAELVELTAVCGLFAQSNRFQDSLAMPIEPPHDVDKIRTSVRVDPGRVKAYIDRLHNALRIPLEARPVVAALNQAPSIESTALRQYLTAVVQRWPAVLPSPTY
jgi:hypothetical protein